MATCRFCLDGICSGLCQPGVTYTDETVFPIDVVTDGDLGLAAQFAGSIDSVQDRFDRVLITFRDGSRVTLVPRDLPSPLVDAMVDVALDAMEKKPAPPGVPDWEDLGLVNGELEGDD